MTICGTIGRCLFGRIHHSRINHNTPRLHLEILHKHCNTQEKVKINLYANFFFFLSFYFLLGGGWGGGGGVKKVCHRPMRRGANGNDRRHQRYTVSKCSHLLMRWQTRHAVIQWLEWRQAHVFEMTQAGRRSCYTSY